MEQELRKAENLRGTPILLGNGETWTVPSLPFGKVGKAVAKKYDELAESNHENTDDAMHAMIDVMVSHLQINYPDITIEKADTVGLFDAGVFKEFCQAVTGIEPKKV